MNNDHTDFWNATLVYFDHSYLVEVFAKYGYNEYFEQTCCHPETGKLSRVRSLKLVMPGSFNVNKKLVGLLWLIVRLG